MVRLLLLPICICLLNGSTLANDNGATLLFVRRIAPLLQDKCLACHGNDEADIQGGLDLRSYAAAMNGGDSNLPAIALAKPNESPIYLAALRNHDHWSAMPPKESEKLYADQLGWLRDWIAAGAPWPDKQHAQQIANDNLLLWSAEDGVVVKTSGGLAAEWTNRRYQPEGLWAYQAVRKNESRTDQNRNSIDDFIADRMPAGLESSPLADSRSLIRRATFDLTGLPPTPEDVKTFVDRSRQSSDAYEELINRLLDSPRYGERMAQHWLDVTRYADTAGFANDYERGNAWRYRDYVIRSFNHDKPYDQFIREQLAGDEIDSHDPEMLIATGFLRMGPWELTGMEVAKVARQRFLDDVTNSVGETFLAQSLQCCRCHDHKFDPIPTRDYYAIQAVFATTQLAEREAPFTAAENTDGFDEAKYLQARRLEYLATLQCLDEKLLHNAKHWFEANAVDATKWQAAVQQVMSREKNQKSNKRRDYDSDYNAARMLMAKQGVPEDQYPPKLFGFAPEDFGNERVARKGLERLRWELERYEPFALAVYDGRTPNLTSVNAPLRIPADHLTDGAVEDSCIHNGGDPFSLGERVVPGVLSVLGDLTTSSIPEDVEGRRLPFANWVANQNNPLTTRAIVNRIWLWHFGQPLAGNPNNFGSTGKKPTHPELLDWLAATFVEQGWSIKKLHRLIMTSQAYRRSATHPAPTRLDELDPTASSYAVFHPRRLSAEELRDAMLSATGELNLMLGGIPCRPEINLEAALQPRQVMGTFAAAWIPNPLPSQRHRRSIYALKVRGLPDPQMEVFNQPTPDFSCERRDVSTVTPQVFSLFNSLDSHARALALANRAINESDSDERAVMRCFELVFSRQPTADELQLCLKHWREIESMIGAQTPPSEAPPLKILRVAVEENTGERFTFPETLHAYADFIPDLQPADVSLSTRALADVCLALLNSNEFSYVY